MLNTDYTQYSQKKINVNIEIDWECQEFLAAADLLNIPVIEILPNLFDRYIPTFYTSRQTYQLVR